MFQPELYITPPEFSFIAVNVLASQIWHIPEIFILLWQEKMNSESKQTVIKFMSTRTLPPFH